MDQLLGMPQIASSDIKLADRKCSEVSEIPTQEAKLAHPCTLTLYHMTFHCQNVINSSKFRICIANASAPSTFGGNGRFKNGLLSVVVVVAAVAVVVVIVVSSLLLPLLLEAKVLFLRGNAGPD
ncbi:hypothetical protein ElyMa_005892000 [Elysia marginata]|uniref:Uncharacterized protein n=1 Tax=Elysia marginata TaxID=1093978 RepID=A0AAV4G6I5_9GAST|nr:hypothetical protein ElyMa_005892000 [Elysia marginata]